MVQNLVQFTTTIDFDCKYLWNGKRYRQAENGVINYNPFFIEQKMVNFGPQTQEIMRLMFTHPKSTVHVLHIC